MSHPLIAAIEALALRQNNQPPGPAEEGYAQGWDEALTAALAILNAALQPAPPQPDPWQLIERLAREAGYDVTKDFDPTSDEIGMPYTSGGDPADEREHLSRFAALVAEECAKVCETPEPARRLHSPPFIVNCTVDGGPRDFAGCAAAIREKFGR